MSVIFISQQRPGSFRFGSVSIQSVPVQVGSVPKPDQSVPVQVGSVPKPVQSVPVQVGYGSKTGSVGSGSVPEPVQAVLAPPVPGRPAFQSSIKT